MSGTRDPVACFHQLIPTGRPPIRADRAAMGTLPVRAVRYCEAVTSATAFGWWAFCPIDLELQWDGSDIFWRCDALPEWMALLPSAQFPDYAAAFDQVAPDALKGCSPPFLTALPEPGCLQIWTGLIAETAPDWHLLVRSMPNLPQASGIALFEGIIETDHWFGPLFVNLCFTCSHMPVRIRHDDPLAQLQPIQRDCTSADTLDRTTVSTGLERLTAAHWDAYYATIVEPNSRPNRPFGEYATADRKRRHACQRGLEGAR